MEQLVHSPLFGIVLSIAAYQVGLFLNRKTKSPLVNPLLVAVALIILFLNVFQVPQSEFQEGGRVVSLFLAPATAVLAVSVYRQIEVLKAKFLPILAGCLVGSVVSMTSAYALCRFFRLDEQLTASMIPKSVTTPIAMEVSKSLGGVAAVTVAAVILSGILGAIFAPLLMRMFHVTEKVAAGVAIGTCSHAIGTSKALELGEVEGAMSGIAIGVAGIITVLLSLFLQ